MGGCAWPPQLQTALHNIIWVINGFKEPKALICLSMESKNEPPQTLRPHLFYIYLTILRVVFSKGQSIPMWLGTAGTVKFFCGVLLKEESPETRICWLLSSSDLTLLKKSRYRNWVCNVFGKKIAKLGRTANNTKLSYQKYFTSFIFPCCTRIRKQS